MTQQWPRVSCPTPRADITAESSSNCGCGRKQCDTPSVSSTPPLPLPYRADGHPQRLRMHTSHTATRRRYKYLSTCFPQTRCSERNLPFRGLFSVLCWGQCLTKKLFVFVLDSDSNLSPRQINDYLSTVLYYFVLLVAHHYRFRLTSMRWRVWSFVGEFKIFSCRLRSFFSSLKRTKIPPAVY